MVTSRGFSGDVYDGGSKEVLQRNEETRFQAAAETDTKAKGTSLIII